MTTTMTLMYLSPMWVKTTRCIGMRWWCLCAPQYEPILRRRWHINSVCLGDIDNDNDLDLFVTNTSGQNDFLYSNNGKWDIYQGHIRPPVTDGAWSNSASFADIDNDGDLDLFVTVGFQAGQLRNRLYYNAGNGSFIRELSGPIVNDSGWTHGLAFGDLDRDGDLDLVCARNLNENQDNALYLNDGNAITGWTLHARVLVRAATALAPA